MSRQKPTFATAPRAGRCSREYGAAGLFGLLTPQSNPTVEPELRILLPAGSAMLAARLTSPSSMLRERLIDYGERLGEFVGPFDDVGLDAVGFACTGTSYLVDAGGRAPAHASHLSAQRLSGFDCGGGGQDGPRCIAGQHHRTGLALP